VDFVLVITLFAAFAGVVLPVVVTLAYCLFDRPTSAARRPPARPGPLESSTDEGRRRGAVGPF
jgi:hypothetical protein